MDKAEYERRSAKLVRTIAAMLDDGALYVRVKRSCMIGDPVKAAKDLGMACVFYNFDEPEYRFTYTPEPVNECRGDDGRLIFSVLRRGPIRFKPPSQGGNEEKA